MARAISRGIRMTKIVKKRICDVCKKEVERFYGSLVLDYSDWNCTGCGFPVKIELEDICIDCCRKLKKVIEKSSEEN